MLRHMCVLLSLILACGLLAIAGNKKKHVLPAAVMNAQTVFVLVDPQAGISPDAPLANRTAQEDVEKALMKWGRVKPVMDMQTADLVITIRKGSGKAAQATVGRLPTNDRPVVAESTGDTTRVGVQQGRPPGMPGGPQATAPHPQAEVGGSDDMLVVYVGHGERPLERLSVWRYSAQDALQSPEVPAMGKFRKAIEDSEKQQQSKP
jgi:hypothetical protein